MKFQQALELVKSYRSLPLVRIGFFGNAENAAIYRRWSARHPRFPLLRRKELGVALIELPDSFSEYLEGKEKEYLRRRRNRAIRLGYTFRPFDISDEIDAVMAVNTSMGVRQGRRISASYISRDEVLALHSQGSVNYGVFDAEGRLAAYAYVPNCGEFGTLSRLFGHGDHLEKGVMFLLITSIVQELIELRQSHPRLRWLNYDMWFGGASGLRFFKQQVGFRPYRVKWFWDDRTDGHL